MDQKALINNVLTAVATAIVLGVLGFFMGIFERGAEAISEDQIEAVIKKVVVTAAGITLQERIAEVDGQLIGLETRVGIITDDVNDLEQSVLDLASD